METILLAQFFAVFFGFSGVLLGALGAHALKGRLSQERLENFETAVRYQMIHALLLLILAFNLGFNGSLDTWIVRIFILGVLLFSGSIYGLVFSGHRGRKWKVLIPLTPLGGILMLAGWLLLGYSFFSPLF